MAGVVIAAVVHARAGSSGTASVTTGGSSTTVTSTGAITQTGATTTPPPTTTTAPPPTATTPAPSGSAPAIGIATFRVTDPMRTMRLNSGTVVPRAFAVVVRYPATGPAGGVDVAGATPLPGRHPLVVFGGGFDIGSGAYASLLQSWARAGYVVAVPVFPLASPDAPSGPEEEDLVHQPGDVSLVISAMERGTAPVPPVLHGVVNPARIGVAGHSDGGDTALAVAEDPRYRDRRVQAAVILSGAEIPFVAPIQFPAVGVPLLAVQGTADPINLPSATTQFWLAAAPPKYLLLLPGMTHLAPYSTAAPQLAVVEHVTIAFLNRYLGSGSADAIRQAGDAPGVAVLRIVP